MRKKTCRFKAALAALALSVAVLAQPLTASAWMLNANQQQLVDNLTTGREALLLGNYTQAVNDLSRAIQLNASSTSAYYYRARAYQYMGRSSDAAADYSRVVMMAKSSGGYLPAQYSDAQSLSIQLGASSIGTSVLTGAITSAAGSVQITGQDGTTRQATPEEAAMVQKIMQGETQPAMDDVYRERFGDPTDHAGVQEVVNKRTAALTATEETYSTNANETIYCGSGHTAICFNGSETIDIPEKEVTTEQMVEEIVDRLNPLSPITSLFKAKEEEVQDFAPSYEKITYALSAPYTAIATEEGKVKVSVPVGTQVKVLYTVSEGVSVGVDYYTFTVDVGEKLKDNCLSGSIYFVGV